MAEAADPYTLLARALRTLTDEEQGVVLRSLRNVLPHVGPPVQLSPGAAAAIRSDPGALSRAFFRPEDDDKVAFLLRLPSSTHSALKTWADTHGHSMNVVVRGLVERFLEDQGVAGEGP